MDKILQAKQEVLETAKKAFDAGLFAGTSGNLSVYVQEENLVVITPSSIRYEGMTIEDIVVIDLDGNVVEGKHRPSSESKMHCAIYKGKQEEGTRAIVHTHSPYATSFAVNNKKIPLILIEMIPFLGGEVHVAPLEAPGSFELGDAVAGTLQGRNCCLMANHGVITVGATMDQAYLRAEYVEDAAKICRLAMQSGEIVLIPEAMENRMRGK